MPKTFGKKTTVGQIQFDSIYESNIYKDLSRFLKESEIQVHVPYEFSSSSNQEDLLKPISWKIDFHIPSFNLFIEAKGRFMPEDYWKIYTFYRDQERIRAEASNEKASNLLVVYSGQPPSKRWFCRDGRAYRETFVSKIVWDGMVALSGNDDFEELYRVVTNR